MSSSSSSSSSPPPLSVNPDIAAEFSNMDSIPHIASPAKFEDIYNILKSLITHIRRPMRLGKSQYAHNEPLHRFLNNDDGGTAKSVITGGDSAMLIHAPIWSLSTLKRRPPGDINKKKCYVPAWQATVHIISALRNDSLSALLRIWLQELFEAHEKNQDVPVFDLDVPLAHLLSLVDVYRSYLYEEVESAIEGQDAELKDGNEVEGDDEDDDEDIIDRKKFFVLEDALFIMKHIPFDLFASSSQHCRPALDAILQLFINLTQLFDINQAWVIALNPNENRSTLYEQFTLMFFEQSFIKNDKDMKQKLLKPLIPSGLFDRVLISQFGSIIRDGKVNLRAVEFLDSLFISKKMENVVCATTKLNSFLDNLNAELKGIISDDMNTDKDLHGKVLLQDAKRLLSFMIRIGGVKKVQKNVEYLGCILAVFCIVFSEKIEQVEDITASNEMFTIMCDFYRWLSITAKDKPTFYVTAIHWQQFGLSHSLEPFFKRIHSHLETLQELPRKSATILHRQDMVNFDRIMQILEERYSSIVTSDSDNDSDDDNDKHEKAKDGRAAADDSSRPRQSASETVHTEIESLRNQTETLPRRRRSKRLLSAAVVEKSPLREDSHYQSDEAGETTMKKRRLHRRGKTDGDSKMDQSDDLGSTNHSPGVKNEIAEILPLRKRLLAAYSNGDENASEQTASNEHADTDTQQQKVDMPAAESDAEANTKSESRICVENSTGNRTPVIKTRKRTNKSGNFAYVTNMDPTDRFKNRLPEIYGRDLSTLSAPLIVTESKKNCHGHKNLHFVYIGGEYIDNGCSAYCSLCRQASSIKLVCQNYHPTHKDACKRVTCLKCIRQFMDHDLDELLTKGGWICTFCRELPNPFIRAQESSGKQKVATKPSPKPRTVSMSGRMQPATKRKRMQVHVEPNATATDTHDEVSSIDTDEWYDNDSEDDFSTSECYDFRNVVSSLQTSNAQLATNPLGLFDPKTIPNEVMKRAHSLAYLILLSCSERHKV